MEYTADCLCLSPFLSFSFSFFPILSSSSSLSFLKESHS